MLIAVYGTLRKGFYNHDLIKKTKYIGTFQTEPKYTMYNIGAFPGIRKNGTTSIKMEVYEVNDVQLQDVDRLEGYRKDNPRTSLYLRDIISTPYGKSYTYIYNTEDEVINDIFPLIKSGDWKQHIEETKINAYA